MKNIFFKIVEKMINDDNLDFDYHRNGMLSVMKKNHREKLQKYNYVDNDRFKILNKDEISEYLPSATSKVCNTI